MLVLRTAIGRRAVTASSRAVARRSHSHDAHHHDAHGAPEVHQHEGFSKGYVITLAALFGGVALYNFDTSGPGVPLVTRLIQRYETSEEEWATRNRVRAEYFQQAGRDRSLFYDSRPDGIKRHKNVEALNMGSPFNQQAGWAHGGDLGTVKAHLEGVRAKHNKAFEN